MCWSGEASAVTAAIGIGLTIPFLAEGRHRPQSPCSPRAMKVTSFPDAAPAAKTAQIATATIPIVALGDDMEEQGSSPASRAPGATSPGVSIFGSELDENLLELLMEMVPAARRMAALAESKTRPLRGQGRR